MMNEKNNERRNKTEVENVKRGECDCVCCAAYMAHRRQEDIQISPLFHFIAFFFFF